jgi:uncharacterized protein
VTTQWAYFDTSALIKRYVDETGRQRVLQLLRRHRCVTSAVLPVELRGALRRRLADGSLEHIATSAILKRLAADRQFWTFIEVTSDVLDNAETLVSTHPLRTLDAIHVASARLFALRLGRPSVLFVSADARQSSAAAAVGMITQLIGS